MTINNPDFKKIVLDEIDKLQIDDFDSLRIRELVRIVNSIEKRTGVKYIRMELGVPGIKAPDLTAKAENKAHLNGMASIYPMIEGASKLKKATSDFVKAFLNINIKPENCVPTVGTMQAAMATFMLVNKLHPAKNKTLFLDPGFPIQKKQLNLLGFKYSSFDIYNFRGEKLRNKLETYLKTEEYSSIVYSNPNNPTWICLSDEELKIIGELADKYDIIICEDLAYFGMDFREDYLTPSKEPYQPSIARYTENYVLWLSASKLFSYAGQRISMLIISENLYNKEYPYLKNTFDHQMFGDAMIYGSIYSLSSGVSHTVQYGFAAILNAVTTGKYNLYHDVLEYRDRAILMKKTFLKYGFKILYDKDNEREIADGFYFTIYYPGLKSGELVKKLLLHGISGVSLKLTGSREKTGIRACVSLTDKAQIPVLEKRLEQFIVKTN